MEPTAPEFKLRIRDAANDGDVEVTIVFDPLQTVMTKRGQQSTSHTLGQALLNCLSAALADDDEPVNVIPRIREAQACIDNGDTDTANQLLESAIEDIDRHERAKVVRIVSRNAPSATMRSKPQSDGCANGTL